MSTERELSDWQSCEDGTIFSVHSELIRGEPRWYWVEKRDAGLSGRSRSVDHEGSISKTKMQRLARRLADEYESAPYVAWYIGPESSVYHNRPDCRLLHNAYKYWPTSKSKEVPRDRRLCKLCEKGSK